MNKAFLRFNYFFKKDEALIHIPIGLSNLIDDILIDVAENFVSAVVVGPKMKLGSLFLPNLRLPPENRGMQLFSRKKF